MNVIRLADIDVGMIDLVGGKATGLARMIKLGERVPDGFCVTTDAFRAGTIPEEEVDRAYAELGGGEVAVRSSATAEDLPDASFAGQQDTFLNVAGREDLLKAIHKCWESLHSERAVAYRETAGIDESAMAVVVQRMVEPVAAGVLFTANPITGTRTEMVVDAAPGLGTAVVDGHTIPDHYVLNGTRQSPRGCLSPAQLDELQSTGERLQEQLAEPQDVEFAFAADGTLWLLQTRPITTLFPLAPDTGLPGPRLYVEFGHIQGMLRPCTPMGLSLIRTGMDRWFQEYGGGSEEDFRAHRRFVPIAGHLYMDITDSIRDEKRRKNLPESLSLYGPRVQDVVRRMRDDPRFAPQPTPPVKRGNNVKLALRFGLASIPSTVRSLVQPDESRARVFRMVDEIRRRSAAPAGLSTEQRLSWVVKDSWTPLLGPDFIAVMLSISLSLRFSAVPPMLLKGIAAEGELDRVLGGMPHNVTTEMNLALWQVSQNAREHKELFLSTPPAELAERHLNGTLPDIGLAEFLESYGFRAAAEIDVGMPRWSEEPTPLLSTIVNYLRVDDPEQAPDLRFERAAALAETTIEELERRARRSRPVRGRLSGVLMRRFRKLIGLREIGKFCMVPVIAATREQLLLIGSDLAGRGLLGRADDIMFLDLEEVRAAVEKGSDQRELASARRATYDREVRRTRIPAAVLSDGTDLEALLPATPADAGDGRTLIGTAGAAGRATGRARVIRDPAEARIEPGEILVAPTTDPGWTPLFMTAAGLVSETGSPLAHGPTVAREYGIPAVICLRDATTQIQTGQLIAVDGAAGTVTILEG